VPDQRVCISISIGPQGSCYGRSDTTADASVRHHLHEHQDWEDEGNASKRIRTKKANEIGLSHPDKRLDDKNHGCRQCQAKHSRYDWAGEHVKWRLARCRSHWGLLAGHIGHRLVLHMQILT
jgi:hypothetical protein